MNVLPINIENLRPARSKKEFFAKGCMVVCIKDCYVDGYTFSSNYKKGEIVSSDLPLLRQCRELDFESFAVITTSFYERSKCTNLDDLSILTKHTVKLVDDEGYAGPDFELLTVGNTYEVEWIQDTRHAGWRVTKGDKGEPVWIGYGHNKQIWEIVK